MTSSVPMSPYFGLCCSYKAVRAATYLDKIKLSFGFLQITFKIWIVSIYSLISYYIDLRLVSTTQGLFTKLPKSKKLADFAFCANTALLGAEFKI